MKDYWKIWLTLGIRITKQEEYIMNHSKKDNII